VVFSIGYNSSVFVATSYMPYDFYALDYDGNIKWKLSPVICYSTPLIGSDSTIYIAGSDLFYAFSPTGDTVWYSSIDKTVAVGVNIDKDGNLYYVEL